MKTSMRFEGGRELEQALASLAPRVSTRLKREALAEAAEPMRKRMGQLAPRRAPHPDMADNIVISNATGNDAQDAGIAVGPAARFFYGGLQEYGTASHGAQPFARPAFDETVEKAIPVIGAALWRELAGRGISRSSTTSGPVEDLGAGAGRSTPGSGGMGRIGSVNRRPKK